MNIKRTNKWKFFLTRIVKNTAYFDYVYVVLLSLVKPGLLWSVTQLWYHFQFPRFVLRCTLSTDFKNVEVRLCVCYLRLIKMNGQPMRTTILRHIILYSVHTLNISYFFYKNMLKDISNSFDLSSSLLSKNTFSPLG